jgi:hypothetical protein
LKRVLALPPSLVPPMAALFCFTRLRLTPTSSATMPTTDPMPIKKAPFPPLIISAPLLTAARAPVLESSTGDAVGGVGEAREAL